MYAKNTENTEHIVKRASQYFTRLSQIKTTLPPLKNNSASKPLSPVVSKKTYGPILAFAGCTSKGIRSTNEDRVVILNKLLKSFSVFSYFAIFDGFSGKHSCSFLRDNLHNLILAHPDLSENLSKAVLDSFQSVEDTLLSSSSPEVQKSGSCALVLITVNDYSYIFSLGSSRCFASSAKGFERLTLTKDHLLMNPKEKERLLNGGSEVLKYNGIDRIKPGMVNVTRCFGCKDAKGKGVIAVPDMACFKAEKLDFLVLTSDGLWTVVGKTEIIVFIWEKIRESEGDLRDKLKSAARELVSKAIKRGSDDNVSIIIVAFKGLQRYNKE